MKILGIETSCDETAAAVVEETRHGVSVLSNVISSQIDIHKKYGGVVPEVAAREHVLNILPVVNEALLKANIKNGEAPKKINAIAVTIGPGLITSLIVGIETAKVLSYAWNVPVVGINHIEGHIYANFIGDAKKTRKQKNKKTIFPTLILTVSGGHTMLVLMRGHGKYETIGETRDDAAGEAFDKAAAMMKIGYPGGPAISAYAEQLTMNNERLTIKLPRPMINSKDYDFSFSGLKTALLYELKKNPNYKLQIPNYCAEFQQAVIDVLISKTIKAAKEYKVKTVMLSGGVSANIELRKQMKKAINILDNVKFKMPDLKYTTDNAPMIATAGYYKAKRKKFTPWKKLKVDCNAEL